MPRGMRELPIFLMLLKCNDLWFLIGLNYNVLTEKYPLLRKFKLALTNDSYFNRSR
jgi:hypothetical protein